VTAVIEAEGLGKRYRRQWALTDCTLSVPAGHVVGLVGLNGAGKTTPAEPGHRDAGTDHRHDRGAGRASGGRP
jgi:ABC-type phosphonate transport system ATPase subunit